MNKINLNGKWDVTGKAPNGEEFQILGSVPGSALNDILNSDIENNLNVFYRDNAENVQKYENYDWVYKKTFVLDEISPMAEIVFEKLDTYCDIYINEKHIAYCDNGYISHKFDISGVLQKGENVIEVYFYSPIRTVAGKKSRYAAFAKDRLYTRRMQCTYGWDWVMRFVTCGICGDVYIEFPNDEMSVSDAYIYTKSIDEDCAEIGIDIDFKNFQKGGIVTFEVYDGEGILVRKYSKYNGEEFMRVGIDFENPKLWFPIGYGDPNLYELVIKCGYRELYRSKFGIKTVKIMQLPDAVGSENYEKCLELKKSEFAKKCDNNDEFSGFILKINGIKIMCKGANWVPCEPFAGKDEKKKITTLLELAKDGGVNMLRVWGGGRFENEHFYNECSRLGIMVTQDFMMACGSYPEKEKWFLNHLKAEAEYAAKLIRNKACLVWWSGDNENAVYGTDEDSDYTGRDSAYKAIAPILYKLDYRHEFLPSSPYGGKYYSSNTVGTTHNTHYLGNLFEYISDTDMADFKDKYKEFRARFIGEEPVMGSASVTSLRKFMDDDDIFGDNTDMWLYHTKNNPFLERELFDYMKIMTEKLFGNFIDGDDRVFKLKYLQYEWIRISLEQARREKWFSSGVVYWMLNDCWPAAMGWSLIDYYGIPKSGYYSFKRGAEAVVGSIDCVDGEVCLYVCNDSEQTRVKVRCYTLSDGGKIKDIIHKTYFDINKNSTECVKKLKEELFDGEILFLEITDENGMRDRAFYRSGKTEIVPCKIEIPEKKDNVVKVKATGYVHAVEFEGEAVFEDNYFSLVPGEEREITYRLIGETDNIEVKAYTLKV